MIPLHFWSVEVVFAHTDSSHLLRFFLKLCNIVSCCRHTEVSTSETVDVSQFPWESQNSKCHLLLVEQVFAKLKDLPATRSLCIQGLPLLTQFTVAVVFLLAHSFYQVGLLLLPSPCPTN